MENTVIKPHKLPGKGRATQIYVNEGDKIILKVYKRALKSNMTATLHFLLGLGSCCYEEKHDEQNSPNTYSESAIFADGLHK